MKTIIFLKYRMALLFSVFALVFSSCTKDEDTRAFEATKIVGVKVNNDLFTPVYTGNVAEVTIPAGRDLSKVKLQLLVVNGDVLNFDNNGTFDCRKPINLTLKGANGEQKEVTLKVKSPPALSLFIIEGMNVAKEDIHFSTNSLIIQVAPNTNLKQLKVSMEFLNGTLVDFTNGVAADYTLPKSFKLKGADGETIYTYDFIITTEKIGPALVKAMTIGGIATDSVVLVAPATLVPYVQGLTDFSNVDVTLETGFGNRIDAAFTGKGLNMLSGANKVKITGSDGIQKEFTISRPQLSLKPLFSKAYDDFSFGANDMAGVAFSGNYIVVSNYSAVGSAAIGPNYYNLSGQQVGLLDKTGVVIAHSLRKLASDDRGALLVVPLGLTDGDQTVYRWNSVTAAPVAYIKYSKASLGVDYQPRSAGINISGSLDGNAIITIGMAQKTDVFIWTVTGGVLNPSPQKLTFPYDKTAFYYSIEPLPIGTPGFVGAAAGTNFNGIISLNNTMSELHKQSGIVATDCRVIKYKTRMYLAYTAYASGKGAFMRVCDITDGQSDSYKYPIFDVLMPSAAANGNNTMDADLAVINGKLHAVFANTNIGMRLYKLEN